MKKTNNTNTSNTKAKKGAKPAKKAPTRAALKFQTCADIMAGAYQDDKRTTFDLVAKNNGLETVTLTIYPMDADFDAAVLNIFGFSIRCFIRQGSNGMFLSFPSHKDRNGEYHDDAACYDKNFHAIVKEVLAAYYSDEEAPDEAPEALPYE